MRQSTGKKIEIGIVLSCVIIVFVIIAYSIFTIIKDGGSCPKRQRESPVDFFTDKGSTRNFKFDIITTEKGG